MSPKKSHSIPKKMKAISWTAGVILLAGLAVIAGIYFEQNTRISSVEFHGNVFTTDEELLGAFESPVGQLADSVSFSDMFQGMKALPYVDDVNVRMNIRGRLSFDVTEHKPIALLVNGSNRMYVTLGGIKLPIIPGKAEDVPLVYGFNASVQSDTLTTDSWKQVEEFLTEARQRDLSWITISEVAWNEGEGVVALSHENGVKLVFGNEQFSERLNHWETFYSEVISKKGIGSFSSIDLRFRNQIVTHES